MFKKISKHLVVIAKTWYWFLGFYIRHKVKKTNENKGIDGITLVITACNRPDKLKSTLTSFQKNCDIEFAKVIFIEDGGSAESIKIASSFFENNKNFISILNDKNIGQLNSIDIAYSLVETEWIFHMEEDWIFTKNGFIDESLALMESDPKILFLSLRSKDDQNNHPLQNFSTGLLTYKPFWRMIWCGFGFNPSLRRLSHYRLLGSCYGKWNRRETSIGVFYYLLGFKVVVKSDNSYFVLHDGDHCSTNTKYQKA